jgi:hypothetical protein
MTSRSVILSAGVLAAAAALPAYAHHSYAMFDEEKVMTVQGTVKEFQWTNPHGWIHVNVADAQGKPVVWSIETGAPNGMARQGWMPKTIVPGDKISITFHPLRNGRPGGSYMSATLPNGKVMGNPNGGRGGD